MRKSAQNEQIIAMQPKYLWFLILCYTMIIVISNWFDPRLIKIIGLDTRASTLIFPFTFLLSDLITEVYGFKLARRAILCGFFFNLFFILYGQIVTHLPSPDYHSNNHLFDSIHSTSTRIIIASIISYFCAEPLNSIVMAKLKIKLNGKFLSLRFVASTVLASGLDSLIFSTLAFFGTIASHHLIKMVFVMWFIKVLIEILGLPLSVHFAKRLKQIEQLDIYDRRTNFYMFCLDAEYTIKDNEFGTIAAEKFKHA